MRGVDSITLRLGEAVSAIDRAIQQNAQSALEPSARSLGAVRGTLYRYTNDVSRNRRTAGLRNVHSGDTIDVMKERGLRSSCPSRARMLGVLTLLRRRRPL